MSVKLDLSQFKHVRSDDNTTTLKHKLGHELTLAHKSLGPESRAQLQAMADGGKVYDHAATTKKQSELAQKHFPAPSPEEMDKRKSEQKWIDSHLKSIYVQPEKKAEGGNVMPTTSGLMADGGKVKENTLDYNQIRQEKRKMNQAEASQPVMPKRKFAHGGEANFAYEAGLPCKNPNCKSHGKPHPNCRCYTSGEVTATMADGGEVASYCAYGVPHHPGCEYAGGGEVEAREIKRQRDESKDSQGNSIGTTEQMHKTGKNMPIGQMQRKDRVKALSKSGRPLQGLAEGGMPHYDEGGKVPIPNSSQSGSNDVQHNLKDASKVETSGSDQGQSSTSLGKMLGNIKNAWANGGMPMKDSNSDPAEHYRYGAQLAEKAGDAILNLGKNVDQSQQSPADDAAPPPAPSPMLQPGMPGASQEPPAPQNDADPNQAAPAAIDDDNANEQEDQASMGAAAPVAPSRAPASQQPMQPDMAPQQAPEQEAPPQDYNGLKDSVKQQYIEEDQAFQHDLNNGHITPLTYHDLFAKKDTLGKIGSIFGLLLGGAGAGLTHGPNMALQMMDKVITNDLEAQKQSKSNAHNFTSLNQARLLQQAQIPRLLAEGKLTQAQAQSAQQDIGIKANAFARMQASRTALHALAANIQNMPAGSPQRQQAEATLAMMSQAVNNDNFGIADRAAAQSALLGYANPSSGGASSGANGQNPGQSAQNGGNDPEQSFQNNQRMLRMSGNEKLAADNESRHIPGIPGLASQAVPQEAKDKIQNMNILDNKVKDVLNFVDQHKNTTPATMASQQGREILKQAKQKAEELTSFYNKSVDSLGMTQGRLGWLEEQVKKNPTSLVQNMLGNNATLREIRDSNAARRNLILSGPGGLGFPAPAPANLTKQQQQYLDFAKAHPEHPASASVIKKLTGGQ